MRSVPCHHHKGAVSSLLMQRWSHSQVFIALHVILALFSLVTLYFHVKLIDYAAVSPTLLWQDPIFITTDIDLSALPVDVLHLGR